MYRDESPGWRNDVKWISGILLVLVVAVLVPAFSLAQLSGRERALPIIERVFELTILPQDDAQIAFVRHDLDFVPGEPLELLPGTGISAASGEIPDLDVESARDRLAQELSTSLTEDGADELLARLDGGRIARQLSAAIQGPAREIFESSLLLGMMPAGLDNGSRLANWPLQAQQNPGEPVQPVVGVFVRVPPGELQGLSPRAIGERVVRELAAVVYSQGLAAAQELVTNSNLTARLVETSTGELQDRLAQLFDAVMVAYEGELADRLAAATAMLEQTPEEREQASFGVVSSEELAGLEPEEANDLIVSRLAERAWSGGTEAVVAAVNDPDEAERMTGAARVTDALSRSARRGYVRATWFLGVLGLLLLVIFVAASRGWGRMANPGVALALAASAGALLAVRLSERAALPVGAPDGEAAAGGSIAYLLELSRYLLASIPQEGIELVLRNHLIVVSTGLALIVLSLLIRIFRAVRPRRRSLI